MIYVQLLTKDNTPVHGTNNHIQAPLHWGMNRIHKEVCMLAKKFNLPIRKQSSPYSPLPIMSRYAIRAGDTYADSVPLSSQSFRIDIL